ncbi:MAG: SDR family oxidoreductase [Rhodospirillaceae bacterium]|nr:SDR family oxidoreductase [Rhodospirillaceae bacterium]
MTGLGTIDFARLAPARGSRLVITGGCGGIGRRFVEVAHGLGIKLAVIDLPAAIARHSLPKGVITIPYDARKDRAAKKAFAELGRVWRGKIDGFVHLPGYMTPQVNLDQLTPEQFDEGMAINLRSAFLALKEVLPMMRANGGGSVLLVASGLATLVEKGTATYSAAKAGIIALTKGLAKENAPAIRVNCIAPAAVDTEFLRGGTGRGGDTGRGAKHRVMVKDMDMSRMLTTIPMGRIGVVDDIVGPMLFLLGPGARFMTGQTLYINGGRLMVP